MIVQLSEDVYYDNFSDAALGAGVPSGWSLVGSGAVTPIVESDASANGSRRLKFAPIAGVPFGFVMNVAGTPKNFEILAKIKSDKECDGINPVSYIGGPGGRISITDRLVGVGGALAARKTLITCNFYCQLGSDHPLYERPKIWIYPQAIEIRTRSTGGPNSDPFPTAAQGASGLSSGRANVLTNDIDYGDVVFKWTYIKLKVTGEDEDGNNQSRARIKIWRAGKTEPSNWRFDTIIPHLFWPPDGGSVGMLLFGESLCGGATYLDDITIAINDATIESVDPAITTICPLPAGVVGEAYSHTLQIEGFNA